LVVDQGVRELRARLQADDRGSSPVTQEVQQGRIEPERSEVQQPPVDDRGESTSADDAADDVADDVADGVPDVTSLALADYDHLSSAQIVAKLDGLDAVEREAIERYERNGRHRRTVLGKLDQMRAGGQ
jgi:hypothetical protein